VKRRPRRTTQITLRLPIDYIDRAKAAILLVEALRTRAFCDVEVTTSSVLRVAVAFGLQQIEAHGKARMVKP